MGFKILYLYHMKNKFNILIFLIVVAFSFHACKKNESDETTTQPNNSNLSLEDVASKLIGAWIWDSTTLSSKDSLKFTYTTTQLKTYLTTATIAPCSTFSTFTLNFTNSAYYSNSNGTGYITTYPTSSNQINGVMAKFFVKGSAQYNDTTIKTINDTCKWCLFPDKMYQNNTLYVGDLSESPYYKCSIGIKTFAAANYVVEKITSDLLVLSYTNSPWYYNLSDYKTYFHR